MPNYFRDADMAPLVALIEAVPGCYHVDSSYEDDSQTIRAKSIFTGWSPSLHKIEIIINSDPARSVSETDYIQHQIAVFADVLPLQKARAEKARELGLDHPSESFELSDPAMQTIRMSRALVHHLVKDGDNILDMIQDEMAQMIESALYYGGARLESNSDSLCEQEPGDAILNIITGLTDTIVIMGSSLLVSTDMLSHIPHAIRSAAIGRRIGDLIEGAGSFADCKIIDFEEPKTIQAGLIHYQDEYLSLNEIIELCDKNDAS